MRPRACSVKSPARGRAVTRSRSSEPLSHLPLSREGSESSVRPLKRRRQVLTKQSVCPNVASHEDGPEDYAVRFEWAAEKSRTHTQQQCPDCGRWVIWVPKKRRGR